MDRRGMLSFCLALLFLLQAPRNAKAIFWHPLYELFVSSKASSAPLPPPFALDGEEARRIDDILDRWQQAGESIDAFSTRVTRWQYDHTFGPKKNDYLMDKLRATLKYRRPDCGSYRVDVAKKYDASRNSYVESSEQLDHIRCDGKSFCIIDATKRTQKIFDVPEARTGSVMRSGPIPFLFPIDATKLKERYWFREETPANHVEKQIWLQAWPKTREHAYHFKYCEIILSQPELRTVAVQLTMPNGKDRVAFLLEDYELNEAASVHDSDFQAPELKLGWKRIAQ